MILSSLIILKEIDLVTEGVMDVTLGVSERVNDTKNEDLLRLEGSCEDIGVLMKAERDVTAAPRKNENRVQFRRFICI